MLPVVTAPSSPSPTSSMTMAPYGHIQLHGISIELSSRQDLSASAQKHVMKHTYTLVCDGDKGYQHEIANHYRDYQQLAAATSKSSSTTASPNGHSTTKNRKRHKKRVEVRNQCGQRELLHIPCFAFPRLGTNLPWRGRQTLCKHYQNQDIQSDTLLKICRATTPLDFRLLFSQVIDGSQRQRSDTKARHRPQKPLHTRTSLEVLSTQSLSAIGQRQRTAKITETLKLHRSARVFSPSKSTRRHSQQAALNSVSGDWHLQLASHCYESDIQWHVNHLADCLRQTKEIGKQPKAINKAKTVRSESDSLEYRQLLKTYFDREAENDNVCNIRIDINGIINRPSSESIGRPAGVQSTDWPDDSSEPAAIVSQPHNDTTMNATIDAINPNHIHQFALHSVAQTFDRQLQYSHNTSGAETAPVYSESSHIDNIIQSLCTLNIDANEYQQQQQRVLPQIVLTDCSSDSRASFDVANSIIATGVAGIASTAKNNNNNNIRFVAVAGAESAHRSTATTIVDSCTSDIIGTAHHSSLLLSLPSTHSQHNGCLTIPDAIYYRSESRPP